MREIVAIGFLWDILLGLACMVIYVIGRLWRRIVNRINFSTLFQWDKW